MNHLKPRENVLSTYWPGVSAAGTNPDPDPNINHHE